MHRIKRYFITWEVRLVAEFGIIKIMYKSAFINFVVKKEVPEADSKAYHTVVDFCFDAYFDYEWKGEPLTAVDLWVLTNLKPFYIREILSDIYKEIRKHGELLQEEQEIRVVHHRRQKPTRSVIQEKQSTGNPRKKEKRIERPLW